jgi:Flp pilus assembly pilin Flp
MNIIKTRGIKRWSRGQGMTEYIIIVALIAVAAIGVYSIFGKTVRNQTSGMAAALGGADKEADTAVKAATNAGKKAVSISNQDTGLDNYHTEAKKQ